MWKVLGGMVLSAVVLGFYSIMSMSSKCSREEEKTTGDYDVGDVVSTKRGTLEWAMNKWEKYRMSTVINNGGI